MQSVTMPIRMAIIPECDEMECVKSQKSLCITFDLKTLILNSYFLSDQQLNRRYQLFPHQLITNNAFSEYKHEANNTTISLIKLTSEDIEKLKKTKLRCLNGRALIYIQIINKKYIKLSSKKQVFIDKLECCSDGIVFAIIFRSFPQTKQHEVTGIYYHGHNSNVYVPNFDEKEKSKYKKIITSQPNGVFVRDQNNFILSIKNNYIKSKKKRKNKKTKKKRKKPIQLLSSRTVVFRN